MGAPTEAPDLEQLALLGSLKSVRYQRSDAVIVEELRRHGINDLKPRMSLVRYGSGSKTFGKSKLSGGLQKNRLEVINRYKKKLGPEIKKLADAGFTMFDFPAFADMFVENINNALGPEVELPAAPELPPAREAGVGGPARLLAPGEDARRIAMLEDKNAVTRAPKNEQQMKIDREQEALGKERSVTPLIRQILETEDWYESGSPANPKSWSDYTDLANGFSDSWNNLLGKPPSKEQIEEVKNFVKGLGGSSKMRRRGEETSMTGLINQNADPIGQMVGNEPGRPMPVSIVASPVSTNIPTIVVDSSQVSMQPTSVADARREVAISRAAGTVAPVNSAPVHINRAKPLPVTPATLTAQEKTFFDNKIAEEIYKTSPTIGFLAALNRIEDEVRKASIGTPKDIAIIAYVKRRMNDMREADKQLNAITKGGTVATKRKSEEEGPSGSKSASAAAAAAPAMELAVVEEGLTAADYAALEKEFEDRLQPESKSTESLKQALQFLQGAEVSGASKRDVLMHKARITKMEELIKKRDVFKAALDKQKALEEAAYKKPLPKPPARKAAAATLPFIEVVSDRVLRSGAKKATARRKKDGMDLAKKKRPTKKDRKESNHPVAQVAQEVLDTRTRKNPRQENPTAGDAREAVNLLFGREGEDGKIKPSEKATTPEERRELSATMNTARRIVTGQPKEPHHYAMLGPHYNDEGHRVGKLEDYRKPHMGEDGHMHRQQQIQDPPRVMTSQETRDRIYRSFMGIGTDRRITSEKQMLRYETQFGRKYNGWPYSQGKIAPPLPWKKNYPSAKQEAAYLKRTGHAWLGYGAAGRPAKYRDDVMEGI